MAEVDLIMPKMGESIMEATIIKWLKEVGDAVEIDESILEIATDKVDSEIPSPIKGTLIKTLFQENDVVEVGKVIAVIETEKDEAEVMASPALKDDQAKPASDSEKTEDFPVESPSSPKEIPLPSSTNKQKLPGAPSTSNRFYSPLVRSMARKEGISIKELDAIEGSGAKGRVTKKDILNYIESGSKSNGSSTVSEDKAPLEAALPEQPAGTFAGSGSVEIIEMDRMRKLIAEHMVRSKRTSAHVTSFVEADVTPIVEWRNQLKTTFQSKYGQNLTFTPIFVQAIVKAIRDFPMINISVDGDRIIKKNDIHIGMATALASGNLIVPVIKNADQFSLVGLAKQVNDLASRARSQKLKPEEIQDGTFTLTNVGTFGNVMGTPIINQPQVAVLATGAIRKKPAVLETEYGDVIAIRHMMFLSLSYDHRVVDGFLGGSFLRKVADYLEQFDVSQTI